MSWLIQISVSWRRRTFQTFEMGWCVLRPGHRTTRNGTEHIWYGLNFRTGIFACPVTESPSPFKTSRQGSMCQTERDPLERGCLSKAWRWWGKDHRDAGETRAEAWRHLCGWEGEGRKKTGDGGCGRTTTLPVQSRCHRSEGLDSGGGGIL